mmetsp:Transcript_19282/g.34920  ORF Transcript_19282/g.34920 Transcript_19282/m.34920 type:complete len:194 (-) Transcript_19282:103-684(-)
MSDTLTPSKAQALTYRTSAAGSQASRRAVGPKPSRRPRGSANTQKRTSGVIGQWHGQNVGHLPLAHLPANDGVQAGRWTARATHIPIGSPRGEPIGYNPNPRACNQQQSWEGGSAHRGKSLPSHQSSRSRPGHASSHATWSIASPKNSQQGGVAFVELFDLACDDSSGEESEADEDEEWAADTYRVYSSFPSH